MVVGGGGGECQIENQVARVFRAYSDKPSAFHRADDFETVRGRLLFEE